MIKLWKLSDAGLGWLQDTIRRTGLDETYEQAYENEFNGYPGPKHPAAFGKALNWVNGTLIEWDHLYEVKESFFYDMEAEPLDQEEWDEIMPVLDEFIWRIDYCRAPLLDYTVPCTLFGL